MDLGENHDESQGSGDEAGDVVQESRELVGSSGASSRSNDQTELNETGTEEDADNR